MRKTITVVLISAALALTATSCKKSKSASSTTTGATTSTTLSKASQDAADKATAQKIVLSTTDAPTGFTSKAATDDPQSDQLNAQLDACAGLPSTNDFTTATVNGEVFDQGNNEISSTARFLTTSDLVDQDFSGTGDAKNFSCITNILVNAFKTGASAQTGSAVTATGSISTVSGITSQSDEQALRLTITATVAGQSLTVYLDNIGFKSGRAEGTLQFTYVGQTPPADLEKSLLAKMHANATSAIAS